jgi:hypothetical protein
MMGSGRRLHIQPTRNSAIEGDSLTGTIGDGKGLLAKASSKCPDKPVILRLVGRRSRVCIRGANRGRSIKELRGALAMAALEIDPGHRLRASCADQSKIRSTPSSKRVGDIKCFGDGLLERQRTPCFPGGCEHRVARLLGGPR